MATIKIQSRVDLVLIYSYLVILLSFIGGYFESTYREIYYITSLGSVGLSLLVFIYFLQNKYFLFSTVGLLIVISLVIFSFIGFITHLKVNLYPFFLVFFLTSFFIFKWSSISFNDLLKVLNSCYFIYLFFSILVYSGLVQSPGKLNQFNYDFGVVKIKTFIGLYGSTSSIDAYSMLIVVANYFYGGKNRFKIILTALFASLLTLRFTPLIIVIVPFLCYPFLKPNKSHLNFCIIVGLFLSFAFPWLIEFAFQTPSFDLLINFGLNGRAFLWRDMINALSERDFWQIVFGFGDTSEFTMHTWDHETNNPHNLYLAILINYGLIIYLLLAIFFLRIFKRVDLKAKLILVGVLAAGIGNSGILSFINTSILFLILGLSAKRNCE